PLQRRRDIPPKARRVVVARIQRQPRSRLAAPPRPITQHGRLAEAGRGTDGGEHAAEPLTNACQQPGARHKPRPRDMTLGGHLHVPRRRRTTPREAGRGLLGHHFPLATGCASVGCDSDLADGRDLADTWGQVWDILPAQWEKINYVLGRRRCSCCGAVNTAVPPCRQALAGGYWPNLSAAAILPSSQGNVPVEATARMMEALLGAKVSTGFVARAHERLAQALAGAGFDDAMVAALRAEDVLCADETPVNVVDNVDDDGGVATGSPHGVTIRTPDEPLVWYREVTARSSAQIRNLGGFDGWHEGLVRDGYAGSHQVDS